MKRSMLLMVLGSMIFLGCGHSKTFTVGLMSIGDLEGKTIEGQTEFRILEGKSCGYAHYLSDAVYDALKGTAYDTLVNVEVTSQTGLFVWSNCILVKGRALNSNNLRRVGELQ